MVNETHQHLSKHERRKSHHGVFDIYCDKLYIDESEVRDNAESVTMSFVRGRHAAQFHCPLWLWNPRECHKFRVLATEEVG